MNRTVEELRNTMSFDEFQDWQEYYNEEPFLSDRIELQLAKFAHTNLATGMSKIDIDFDYFLVSKQYKENKPTKSSNLAQTIKTIFNVKG